MITTYGRMWMPNNKAELVRRVAKMSGKPQAYWKVLEKKQLKKVYAGMLNSGKTLS